MTMTVKKGDKILAIDENKILVVEGLWGNASQIVDFSARYTESNVVDKYGNKIYGNRGFSFKDENKVWKKLN
jgi:hypothetical protein